MNFTKNTLNRANAKHIPAGYANAADSLNPSFAIRIYVRDTADIKVAGNAVINDPYLLFVFLRR